MLEHSPPSERLSGHVVAIGVGSAGCRITSQLRTLSKSLGYAVFVSSAAEDVPTLSNTRAVVVETGSVRPVGPAQLRSKAENHRIELEQLVRGARAVLVVSGLGGVVGSTLSPWVAGVADAMGAATLAIVLMPFRFERHKHFEAALALRRLRRSCDGVVVVDNEELVGQLGEIPAVEAFARVNQHIAVAIDRLLASQNPSHVGVGLQKLLQLTEDGRYAILSLANAASLEMTEEAVRQAVEAVYRTCQPDRIDRVVLLLEGEGTPTTAELATSANHIRSRLGGGSVQLEYGIFRGKNFGGATAVLLAAGFAQTKFDRYDPLSVVLSGPVLDDAPESSLNIELPRVVLLD